jgi:hypothetical protein
VPAEAAERQAGGPISFDTSVFYTFPGTPAVSVSRHGNIVRYEGPAGFEQIGIGGGIYEGYVLCYGAVRAFDIGETESGFQDSFPVCSGSVCTITRRTTDNRLELRQIITKNAPFERSVNVAMTVTNISTRSISGIRLRRHVDPNVDSQFNNWFAASERDSVTAWNPPDSSALETHAFLLRHFTRSPMTIPTVAKVVPFSDSSCSPSNAAAAGPVESDLGSSIEYTIGSLARAASATVTIQYQRN